MRIMLTVAAAVAVLLVLACIGYNRWEVVEQRPGITEYFLASAGSKPEFCISDEETRERIRNIMIDALDDALREQIKFLFQVWMKDDRGQPERARVGAGAAIRAHQAARKNAVEWMPPICSN